MQVIGIIHNLRFRFYQLHRTAAGSGSDYYYDGYQQSFVFGPSGFSYGVGANCDQSSAFSRMMGSAENFTPGIVNSTEKKLADRFSPMFYHLRVREFRAVSKIASYPWHQVLKN